MKNEFPLYASTAFVCPGDGELCPIKARIRDFGSCVVRIYSIESLMGRGTTPGRPRPERGIKAEFTVTECAECGYNKIAAAVIRELIDPTPRPKPYPRGEDVHRDYNYE